MFNTILIANRGEIACRVIRTAHQLGIRCVAVYSEADAGARHVAMADEAHLLGPAEAAQSYLRADAILDIARQSGAQAVHPGYGFMSENAGFARACADSGIAFIGPPVAAIEAMGSKSAAKAIMEKASVPLVPGYHGDDQSDELLIREAERIGYPLLVKAAMGGGGKGMRVVESPEKLLDGLNGARREARNAFGDDTLLLEKYLTQPRHVEVQVFADRHGNCIYLGDRDCSAQRRHQKVVEEAPAPGLSDELRRAMGEAAVRAAQAIGYEGAGTVEFLLDGEHFYFMEMNTRLQVEHPVTELVTGTDLVEWQLRIAAGEALPLDQAQVSTNGHAVEARIYAEDPARDFLPQSGLLEHLKEPADEPGLRIDTGVREGDQITPYYDPMIAKLIVHGPDRTSALLKLQRALDQYRLAGIKANVGFLHQLVSHPDFMAGRLTTKFIDERVDELTLEPALAEERLALAALWVLVAREQDAERQRTQGMEPGTPWLRSDSWRLNSQPRQLLRLDIGNEAPVEVEVEHFGPGWRLGLHGHSVLAEGSLVGDQLHASLDGKRTTLPVWRQGRRHLLFEHGHVLEVAEFQPDFAGEEESAGQLTAPMNGTIVSVLVQAGDSVEEGQALVVMEAMKMEYTISAPRAAVVAEVFYGDGDKVSDGAELVALEDA
ncbi:acetyl/propionyl/methylcrotonyl-CoA carboxylase subunit alpha [Gallaecimonas sp. GXIMD4217]|uniref:acetyl/propionyl/methylcrotonyl-CoA carboxylase subunit alpha n=1 Tax=Gallaecimonas sp. GXIMD4217 TaxID=3131927 RepID=UPI00311ACBF5